MLRHLAPAPDVPPPQVPALRGVRQLALGGTHSLALLDGGQLMAWGANQNGLLGLGSKKSEMNARSPTLVPGVSCEQVRL